jgi:hypothetical protein
MFASQPTRRLASSVLLALCAALASHRAVAEAPAPPQPKFKIKPLVALREALDLLPAEDRKIATDDELELFRKVAAKEVNKISLSDATLTIAGVTNDKDREHYLARLKEITAEARKAIADATTPEERANKLADYLFKGPCHGGFIDNQVDICRVLDRGEFNCASASILYNNIASRLGIKTRFVEAPGHVFLRMGDLNIEPVCGKTYGASDHQKIIDRMSDKAKEYIRNQYDKDHTYVAGNLGLIAEPYMTRGGDEQIRNRIDLTTIDNLKLACMDAGSPMNAFYLNSSLKKWFKTALKDRQFDKAQKLAAIYGQLFGDDSNKLFAQVAASRAGRSVKS